LFICKSMKPAYIRHFGEAMGFTLIELMVTMTIVIVFSGASLVTFVNYRDVRSTRDEAEAVAERLRTIQIKATATEIPEECSTVSNYIATYDGTNLTVTVSCLDGLGSPVLPKPEIADLSLALENSAFNNSGTITFDSRTVSATGAILEVCGNKKLFTITVSGSANVGKPVAADSC